MLEIVSLMFRDQVSPAFSSAPSVPVLPVTWPVALVMMERQVVGAQTVRGLSAVMYVHPWFSFLLGVS